MPASLTIGNVTVTALTDGEGVFFQPREEAFRDARPEQWRHADRADPAAVTQDGQWRLPFRCYALRPGDGPVILVDAGIGPADAPAASWAPVPGRLPAELTAAGIDPAEVATVVLTHLHTDHVGWAVTGLDDAPYFPNARYLLQQAELDAVDVLNPELRQRLIAPLRAAGQLQAATGDTRLDDGIRVVATPGHTPGHQSVLLTPPDGEQLLVTGDLLVHTVQLLYPELAYAHEVEPATARDSRIRLLRDLAARGPAILATPHLGEPFVRL